MKAELSVPLSQFFLSSNLSILILGRSNVASAGGRCPLGPYPIGQQGGGWLAPIDAASESLANCGQRGATDCKVVLAFNNQCAAFVSLSDSRFGGSTFARAASVDAASKMAVDACVRRGSDGCKVIYSGWTEPEFEKF
ncbi:DUF4189 domain-containing protein [Stenotrophomonas maltophilia]|nr:DUF4189 domain-containing protein [Stenotrophomonas maltophilia]